MVHRLRPSLASQCLSCTRSYVEAGTTGWKPLFGVGGQTRSITMDKDKSIAVQLLKPKHGYGKPGRYVPVSRGKMRSLWFPHKIARYAVADELKAIKDGKIQVERDFEFGQIQHKREKKTVDTEAKENAEPTRRKIKHISPQRAMDLLGVLLPSRLDFPRAVHADSPDATGDSMPIYGSVSTTDIVQEIRTSLSHNDEAARITLDENDVKFVHVGLEDPTRAKRIGVYSVSILVKGSDASPVTRKVHVNAQG